MRIVFDIETNGMLYQPWRWSASWKKDPPPIADRVHCICLTESGSGKIERYHDDPRIPRDGDINDGIARLDRADILIGHNIIRYDIPVLEKLRGRVTPKGQTWHDTLVMAHLGYTSLLEKDKRMQPRDLPDALYGKQSLRAWGYRIGCHKGHVNDTEDWSTFDEDMLRYCARDVEANDKLYRMFRTSWADKMDEAVRIEHEFVVALESQMNCGWHIDEDAAWELVRKLTIEKNEMEEELLSLFPPRLVPPQFIFNTDTCGVAHGADKWIPNPEAEEPNKWWNPAVLKRKEKVYPFKPNSSIQVIWNLNKKYGWVPKKFTNKGNPEFGEAIIATLPFEECKGLVRYSQVCSRLAELCGDSGYLTLLWEDARLHGRIDHCGAVTHRCTHSSPNMGNVTGVTNRAGVPQLYGKEMRALFTVPDDSYCIVGADASGLELRMLGNAMARFDGGDYAREVVDGDAHTKNVHALGLSKWYPRRKGEDDKKHRKRLRTASKSIVYAHNYGAANFRLGSQLVPEGEVWSDAKTKKAGKEIRSNLMAGLPALKELIDSLKEGWREGSVILGIDGREAENRAAYQSLNTKLQMDGAIVIKWATAILHGWATATWGPPSKDGPWCMVGHVHDEMQFQVKKSIAKELGKMACDAITEAGDQLGVACRLSGEHNVGVSWADTH